MLPRISLRDISQRYQLLIYGTCLLTLSYWAPNSLADTSIYFNGGRKLVHGFNPYDGSSPFFSAPLGGKFLFAVGQLLQIEQFPIVWQMVNIFGVSLFFLVIMKLQNADIFTIPLMSILLLTAPVREMVVNNQVTGFALGVSSLVIYLSDKFKSQFLTTLLFLPMYCVFELKPNIVLGLLTYYLLSNRNSFLNAHGIFILVVLFFNLTIFSDQYILWLKYITSQGVSNITGFESLGLSTLFFESSILGLDSAKRLGLLIFLFVLAVYVFQVKQKSLQSHIIFIPLITVTFPYLHLIDLIIALPFIFPRILEVRRLRFLTPLVFTLTFLPRPSISPPKNLLIVVLIIIVGWLMFRIHANLVGFCFSIFVGLFVFAANPLVLNKNLTEHAIQNFTVLRVWLILVIVLILFFLENENDLSVKESK